MHQTFRLNIFLCAENPDVSASQVQYLSYGSPLKPSDKKQARKVNKTVGVQLSDTQTIAELAQSWSQQRRYMVN